MVLQTVNAPRDDEFQGAKGPEYKTMLLRYAQRTGEEKKRWQKTIGEGCDTMKRGMEERKGESERW